MKKVFKITSMMLIIAAMTAILFGCKKKINLPQVDFETVRPTFASTLEPFVIPTDETELIAKAYELYDLANKNDQKVDERLFYSYCPTSNIAAGMDNKIDLHIFELKNKNEYFRIDYRVENNIPLFNAFPAAKNSINKMLTLVTTERQYYKTGMQNRKFESVLNSTINEAGIPVATWDDIKKQEDREIPYFNASQELNYQKFDHTVSVETIKTASIEKIDNYYLVRVSLDCENPKTTEKTRKGIQDGSGDERASYISIDMEFEIWDNGYYKQTKSVEHWGNAKVMSFSVESTFTYTDKYEYDLSKTSIATYADAQEIRNKYAS